jgi:hypothetical protein
MNPEAWSDRTLGGPVIGVIDMAFGVLGLLVGDA